MSETVKLIIEIPKDMFEWFKNEEIIDEYDESALKQVFKNGILLDDVKAEIEASMYCFKDIRLVKNANASGLEKAIEILDNIGKAENE